jgi:asparagine synthetase B (glutamine-hydrolysing)
MCQIQLFYNFKKKINKKNLKDFIRLMTLGDISNKDAFGLFNEDYSMKQTGKFDYKKIDETKLSKGNFIIGHNRFSTNKKVTFNLKNKMIYVEMKEKEINNHPFILGDLIFVHNGVIFNDDILRNTYKIKSDIKTDSYTILRLIDYFLKISNKQTRKEKLIEAIQKAMEKISGTYSIFLYDKKQNKLFYFKETGTEFYFTINKETLIGSTKKDNLKWVVKEKEFNIVKPRSDVIYSIGSLEKPLIKEGILNEIPFFEEKFYNERRLKKKC